MDTRDPAATRFSSRLFYGNACFWVNRAFLSSLIYDGSRIIHDAFEMLSFFLCGVIEEK